MTFYNDDRLGIGLGERARQRRQLFEAGEVEDYERLQRQVPGVGLYGPLRGSLGRTSINTLPDSRWDAFFQALDEAGVDRAADESVGARRGMFPRPSIHALDNDETEQRTGTGRRYQSHEAFTKRFRK